MASFQPRVADLIHSSRGELGHLKVPEDTYQDVDKGEDDSKPLRLNGWKGFQSVDQAPR